MKKILGNIWSGWIIFLAFLTIFFVAGRIFILNYSVISFNNFSIVMAIVLSTFFYALPPDKPIEVKKKDDKFKAGVFEGDDA